MNAEIGDASPVKSITIEPPLVLESRVQEARRLFRRTLASWASDLLILRSRGMRDIKWRSHPHRSAA